MTRYSSSLSRSQLSRSRIGKARRRRQQAAVKGLYNEIFDSILSPPDSPDGNNNGLTKSGTERQRKRDDYSRSAQRPKSDNPWETLQWLRAIRDERVRDPTSREGKEFRRKFRVPFPVFEKIVNICKESNDPVFNISENLIGGKKSIPLELKIMSVLRILAGGLTFKDGAELTQYMSETTCNRFFREHFQSRYIRPQSGDDLRITLETYARLGLPGCVGSIDATFVGPWDGCAHNLKNVCSGDKGKGLLYEVVVNHSKLVVSVEGGYWGTVNDKCSVIFSQFIKGLREKTMYNNVSYKIRTGHGSQDFQELSQMYVISDGGYLDWPCMIAGFSCSSVRKEYKFSDWIASVRKDVECFFGILKQRFRWFKCPICIRKKEDVDNAFVTACIINNMILTHDGLDTLWEDDVNWKTINPRGEDVAEPENEDDDNDEIYAPIFHDGNDNFEPTFVEALLPPHSDERDEFLYLRSLLANHLQIQYSEGKLCWPKTRAEIKRHHNSLTIFQMQETYK